MQPLGVYVHIPFCKRKCAYCDFYSLSCPQTAQMDDYLSALQKQIRDFFGREGKLSVDTLYIGGGTPSVFGAERLCALLNTLRERVDLLPGAEVTVEVNPESVDEPLLRALKAAGVNRISMGIQSSDDVQLASLGRLHDFARAKDAVTQIKVNCTENLSVDLMYGLPGQSMESWRQSVEDILALHPAHVSCYALKLEEGTPLWRQNPVLPDDDLQAEMYLWLVARLQAAGYHQYEISNFSLPGKHSRHNSRYWDLRDYIGFGCGAHSYYKGQRFSTISDLNGYIAAMEQGGSVLEAEDETEAPDRAVEYLMLGLRTAYGVEAEAYTRLFGRDFAPCAAVLQRFLPAGYVKREGDRWYLTPEGFLVSNAIIGDVLDAAE